MIVDEAFLERLRAAFRVEADEHLQALTAGLIELERVLGAQSDKPYSPEAFATVTESIFREAHSLKGAARAVNFHDIESLCQALEDVFSDWKNGAVPHASRTLFDPLHAALDLMQAVLNAIEVAPARLQEVVRSIRALKNADKKDTAATSQRSNYNGSFGEPPIAEHSESTPAAMVPVPTRETVSQSESPQLEISQSVAPIVSASGASTPPAAMHETIRISTAKLDTLLLQAEEMLAIKITSQQRAAETRELEERVALWRKQWQVLQPELNAFAHANGARAHASASTRLLEFLEWNHAYFGTLETRLAQLAKACEHDRHATSGLVDGLLDDTKKLLMQPFSTMLAVFPKLVRDLAREQNKELDFEMAGGEIEIDKRILEEMKAPLTHLVRNAIDHALEMPEVRAQNGKTPRGSLKIEVAQTGGKIEIVIRDDGAGINAEKVKAAAIKNGVLAAGEAEKLSAGEALELIFRSSVSTAPLVTELSGRGLGMAIVREKVEKLGGTIAIETLVGRGTTFRIALPLTLATFRGLLVCCGDGWFILPTVNVERVRRIKSSDIQSVEGRPTLCFGGEVLAFARLHEVLSMAGRASKSDVKKSGSQNNTWEIVAVVQTGGVRVALLLDEVLGEQEVLLKSFEKPLVRVRHFAGATVLGSGRVAPILNVADVIQSATQNLTRAVSTAQAHSGQETRVQRILVADDSITSRMLIKNILEAAGFQTQTAVDGADALTELRAGEFDLLVSDVDMPHLTGFGLAAAVRADARLADLPIILVTGRETRDDRERGIEVGANAYLVKSSFDQTNLLEVVRRFI